MKKLLFPVLLVLATLVAQPGYAANVCNKDGQATGGERCDPGNPAKKIKPDLLGKTCVNLPGGQFSGGTLSCNGNCDFDTSKCVAKKPVDPCQGFKTDDGKACTTDSCVVENGKAKAINNPVPMNGKSCNDGNACTQTDSCQAGTCTGSIPKTCTASDQCHTAGTCDPATGACSNPAAASGTSCNDGNGATVNDKCQTDGSCKGESLAGKACDDGNACTSGEVTDTSGKCNGGKINAGTACDDKDANTTGDQCQADGSCKGVSIIGQSCDDKNLCTTNDKMVSATECKGSNPKTCTASDQCHMAGTCDPATGTCSNPAAASGTSCNDGNACTKGETCLNGLCGQPIAVAYAYDGDDCTDDICNPKDGKTSNPPKSCPTGTKCQLGACVASSSSSGGSTTGGGSTSSNSSTGGSTSGSSAPQGASGLPPSPPANIAKCGNNIIEPGEVCDGTQLTANPGDMACAWGGTIQCSNDCKSLVDNCGKPPANFGDTPPVPINPAPPSDTKPDALATGSCNNHMDCNRGVDPSLKRCDLATHQCKKLEPTLSAGNDFTCQLNPDNGKINCWGTNDKGQLGVATQAVFVRLAAGQKHACGVTVAGDVLCWGDNSSHQVGEGTGSSIKGLGDVVEIAAGSQHTCALKADQTVWCWGNNSLGQLGVDNLPESIQPVMIPTFAKGSTLSPVNIVAGDNHNCAQIVSDNSYATCWGANDHGQLGRGLAKKFDANPSYVVEQGLDTGDKALSNISGLAAGTSHTCAIVLGKPWCWGDNSFGQLGTQQGLAQPEQTMSSKPVAVKTYSQEMKLSTSKELPKTTTIECGNQNSCLIGEDGKVWCWGFDPFLSDTGELISGKNFTAMIKSYPGQAMTIAAGQQHTCVFGSAWIQCWGASDKGQLKTPPPPSLDPVAPSTDGGTGSSSGGSSSPAKCEVSENSVGVPGGVGNIYNYKKLLAAKVHGIPNLNCIKSDPTAWDRVEKMKHVIDSYTCQNDQVVHTQENCPFGSDADTETGADVSKGPYGGRGYCGSWCYQPEGQEGIIYEIDNGYLQYFKFEAQMDYLIKALDSQNFNVPNFPTMFKKHANSCESDKTIRKVSCEAFKTVWNTDFSVKEDCPQGTACVKGTDGIASCQTVPVGNP